jgi:hypothetical protein
LEAFNKDLQDLRAYIDAKAKPGVTSVCRTAVPGKKGTRVFQPREIIQ